MRKIDPNSVRNRILALDVGGSLSFPLERAVYIRGNASNFGLTTNRRFCTSIDKAAGTITVMRTE